MKNKKININNIAILVRASYQTRAFEERFIKIGMPYKIIGGTKFYDRLEVRDALAYLRILISDYDDLALERIINTPKRGIGEKSVRKIEIYAREKNISLLQACKIMVNENEFGSSANNNLKVLIKNLQIWRDKKDSLTATEIAEIVLEESGYVEMWQKDKSIEAEGRLENLKELVNAISEFDNINGFLEHIQLVMDNNSNNKDDSVNILTLHAAKGLEYKCVFLPGWEEEIFPNKKSLEEKQIDGLEEERRLAYVGITRARESVYISHANSRFIHGQWFYSIPSRFINELPTANTFNKNELQSKNIEKEINSNFFNIDSYTSNLNISHEKILKGKKVFHQKFGYGIVVNVDGENAEVEFQKTNLKKVKKEYLSTDA